jgi:hypothetical protein
VSTQGHPRGGPHRNPRRSLGRLPRWGELLALAGAALIAASLALRWYETPGGSLDAWDTFGAAVVLLLLAAAAAVLLTAVTLLERAPAVPVAVGVWTTVLGWVAMIAAVVRALERPHAADGLCAGPWLALGGAFLVAVGGWLSMSDERAHRYPPADPERRDVPPA